MKKLVLLPGLLALLFLAAACLPAPELRDDTLLQDTSLLQSADAGCAAPCWRGITPGITPWQDALIILEDDPTLTDPQTQAAEDSAAEVAEWGQTDGSTCCQMFSEDGETVNILFLRTAPTVDVGDVIQTHGEPAYVVGSPFSETQAIMNLIYPEIPMVLYAFVEGTTGSLTSGSEIIGVLYMRPQDMQLLVATSNLHAWDGYASYTAYEAGEFEVTPSVTLTPTPEGE